MTCNRISDTTSETTPIVWGSVLTSNPILDNESLWVIRLILPPGAEFPHWTRLGLTIMYVESGILQFTGVTGKAVLTRGVRPVEHTATRTGEFTRMEPGDSVTVNQGIQHSLFNPVDRPTSIIVTTIAPSDIVPFDGLWTAEGYPIVIDS